MIPSRDIMNERRRAVKRRGKPAASRRTAGGLDIPREIDKLCHLFRSLMRPRTRMLRVNSVMRRTQVRAEGAGAIVGCVACCAIMFLAGTRAVNGADDPKDGPSAPGRSQTEPEPPHHAVKRFEIGQGPRSYFIFEPDKPKPEGKAPVVVFLHGWFAVNPGFYGAWIDHLVRDGRIVIFPRYQNDVGTLPQDFLP